MNTKLSIIIVNWNTREMLKETLAAVFRETVNLPIEVIVIDNASADDSVAMVGRDFPEVVVIANNENLGFGKANNQGLKVARGEYLMFLNSDVIVLDRALEKLVKFLEERTDVAMVGPRLLNTDGTFQLACRRNLPNPVNAFLYLTGLSKLLGDADSASYKREQDDENISGPTEALSGAAMLFRRSVYDKIGGFDEEFFMYGEDLDFCKRVLDNCGPIWYLAESKITHLGGASSSKRRIKSLINFYDAMWLYYRKHYKKEHNFVLRSFVWIGIKSKLSLALVINAFKHQRPPRDKTV